MILLLNFPFQGANSRVSPFWNPAKLGKERSSVICGNCHSNSRFRSAADRAAFNDDGLLFRPGGDFDDSREFTHLGDEGNFWSDGVVRIAGREFTSLLVTSCYTDGEMSCQSCHSMHKDPLDDLVAASPEGVHAWMVRKAALADGTHQGLPVLPLARLERIIEGARSESWLLERGRAERDA